MLTSRVPRKPKLPSAVERPRCEHEPLDAITLLHRQAAETPKATAVTDRSGSYSYERLECDAVAVADLLRRNGIRPGDSVGVHTQRAYEAIASMLGILEAGAVYVPLDTKQPQRRLQGMCAAANVRLVLCDPASPKYALAPTVAWSADQLSSLEAGEIALMPHVHDRCDPSDDAYIMFTSGSTGIPKGVRVTRGNLAQFLSWVRGAFTNEEMAVTAAVASVGFDLSILELFGPLSTGGSVRIMDSALALGDVRSDATMLVTTPSVASELLRGGMIPDTARTMLLCGEVLTRTLADRLLAESGITRLVNTYGPTESTVLVTAHEVVAGEPGPVPLGTPLAGTEVVVLGEDLTVLGTDVEGELAIVGPQVAAGYLGAPALTADRFVEIELRGTRVRAYRTGDVGTTGPDANVRYLGRADRQVKVRGFRIEPGDVESAIERVIECDSAVVRSEGSGSTAVLAAYVVTRTRVDARRLRDSLRCELPDYMIPSRFVRLEALPLTPSGKVDHQCLDAMTGADPPSTEDEPAIAALVRSVLGPVGVISPELDFLEDLGGTSLTLIALLARIEEVFDRRISVREAVRDTTIGGLGQLVGGEANDVPGVPDAAPPRSQPARTAGAPALFLVNPYVGAALRHRRLARHVSDPSRMLPVDIFDVAPGPNGRHAIADLAAAAVREIRRVQPTGPYLIGGHSAGGLIALEVARVLRAEGDDVPELLIIDAPLIRSALDYAWSEVVMNWPDLRNASWPERWAMAKSVVTARASMYARRPSRSAAVGHMVDRSARLMNLAAKRYRPQPYAGEVRLLLTDHGVKMARGRRDLGWSGVLGARVVTVRLPGLHNTLFDPPNVAVLAAEVDRHLERHDCRREPGTTRSEAVPDLRRSELNIEMDHLFAEAPWSRMLLFGNFANGNVGDNAILASTLLGSTRCHRLDVVSRNPGNVEEQFGARAIGMTSPRLLWAILRCDVVAIGGGGMFGNGMTMNTALLPFVALFAQRVLRKRALFLGTGAYSSSPRFVQKALRQVASRAPLVAVRDEESASVLGVRHAVVVPDPAVSLPPAAPEVVTAALAAIGVDPAMPLLGVALKPCGYVDRDDQQVSVAVEAAEWWLHRIGGDVVFFCFSENGDNGLGAATSDGSMAAAALERLSNPARAHIVPATYPPGVMKGLVGRLELMLAHRLHAQIFAWAQGVPLVGLTYERKSEVFLNATSQPRLDLWDLRPGEMVSRLEATLRERAESTDS